MRIRRSFPQKQLTEEQKARALELQERLTRQPVKSPMSESLNNPISSRNTFGMNRGFMAEKKMTFEEKYVTKVEAIDLPIKIEEDEPVPPSLEEDPNQSSPLNEDMKSLEENYAKYNDMDIKDLRELYKSKGGKKDLSKSTKKNIIDNLIKLDS